MRGSGVRFGYAEADITPTVPVELVGFDRPDNRSRGVRDPLLMQVSVWEDRGTMSSLIAMDSLGLTVDRANRVRDAVAAALSSDRERVMLCFSHTHAAPNAATEEWYLDLVIDRAVECVRRAGEGLVPVEAAWGLGEADIGVNRRDPRGALDRRIGILEVVDADTKRLRLLLLRVTAHANVLSSDNHGISSDFLGTVRTLLGKEYRCPIMVTQGASGNVRPRFQHSRAVFMEEHPRDAAGTAGAAGDGESLARESAEALGKMAVEISRSVGAAIGRQAPSRIDRLEVFSMKETCAADVPSWKRAQEIADEARREAGIDGTAWLSEVKRLRAAGIHRQEGEVEIQFFLLDRGCLCGVADEAMCEIALDISRKAGDGFLLFGGYTNGCTGYLATEEEYAKGGFEVLWSYQIYFPYHGRVMPWNRDTAGRLTESVVGQWKRIRGGTPS